MTDVENGVPVEAGAVDFDLTLKKKKKSSKSKASFEGVDEVTDAMAELGKKKKKKEKTEEEAGGEAGGEEFEFKKKKKKSKAAFDEKLEKAGIEQETDVVEKTVSKYGTVNADGEPDFTYEELLSRFFGILRDKNPDMAGDRSGIKYKIPPPAMSRDGNKKSLFSNVNEIAAKMNRSPDHVIQFLFAELGTSGSVDGSGRLVIKGRFQQKQIETVLRRYILEYVTCKTCKSVNTKLSKENRLYFLDCQSCGSRRSVTSIKTGYQAIIRRGRR